MSFVNGTQIEIIHQDIVRGRIRHALFDFDGTLSLIREGWQSVMISMMVEVLLKTSGAEEESRIVETVREFVTRLTGKQTIYQMIQLVEEVRKRGGEPLDPLRYKQIYHNLLWERIKGRVAALEAGLVNPDEMIVPGSRAMLEELIRRGVRCYLASGTDVHYVQREAALLDISKYFDGIYGALDDYKRYDKHMVVQDIMVANHLTGPEFVAFGDGYVEIEDTHHVGGIAVGIASNEAERQGINEWKRSRLIQAGADLIIPDFGEYDVLIAFLNDLPREGQCHSQLLIDHN
jgi:phosphoglycolate phosphatase